MESGEDEGHLCTSEMDMQPKRVSPSALRLTFLTDNVKLAEESQGTRSRRADFVLNALQPALDVFGLIQDDCKNLDSELQSEIISAFQAMRISAERKFQAAAKRLAQAQKRLEDLEEEIEKSDAVVNLRREIDLYSDKVDKGERLYATWEGEKLKFEGDAVQGASDIRQKKATLKDISRENISLHRELAGMKLPKMTPRIDVPLANVFKTVPFDVFTELSSQEVGHLTLKQIQAFIAYKKHIEWLREQIETEKTKSQFQKLTNIGLRSRARVEDFFMQCVAAYAQMEMGSYRNATSTRSLDGAFVPLPSTMQFETMISARLYEINQSYGQSLKRDSRNRSSFSRQELERVPIQFVIRVLLSKKRVLERLQYFLSHKNAFRDSTETKTEPSLSGSELGVSEVKWSLREDKDRLSSVLWL